MTTSIQYPGTPLPHRRSLRATVGQLLPASLLTAYLSTGAAAITELQRGDPMPPIRMQALDGRPVDTSRMQGQIVVVLFGEAGQEKTRIACEHVRAALDQAQLADEKTQWLLLLSKHSDVNRLGPEVQDEKHSPLIAHDEKREVFGTYKVAVLPSVVIVDKEGRIVHALAGLTPRFADIVTDALRLAAGRIDAARFEQTLHPAAESPGDDDALRAARLTQLARQLQRRGMDDAAAGRYREALQLVPGSEPARLALADLLRRGDRLDEAEALCRAALAENPKSLNAALGLASVYLGRGADRLDAAEELLRDVLRRSPARARAHYLMGRIHEDRKQTEQAAASYRRAVELMIEQQEGESSP